MNYRRFVYAQLIAAALIASTGNLPSVPLVHAHEQDEQPEKPPAFHYVCPMHEDVTSKKPGKCRKCKMKLEKKRIKEPETTPSNQ